MAPRELILGISKGRMEKLKGGSYGHTIPVKLRGAGGEIIGGMLFPSTARKAKKTAGVAAEIGKILLDTQGYTKEGNALSQVGRVVSGAGNKKKKVKNTIGDISQIAALLGQTSGYMTPQQAAATQAIGSLIQGSGPSDLTGDVFYPPEAVLPPRARNARPRVAVGGGAPVTKKKFAVQ